MTFIASKSWEKLNEELYVTGTGGYIHINWAESLKYHFNTEKSDKPRWRIMDEEEIKLSTVSTTSSGGNKDLYLRGFVGEVDHFLNCVIENREPIASASDNVKTMKIVDMILGR